MSKLPVIDAKTFEKILLQLGFRFIRQKGSHVFYRHHDGRFSTIPHHKGQDINRPLIRQILKEINLSVEEFTSALNKV